MSKKRKIRKISSAARSGDTTLWVVEMFTFAGEWLPCSDCTISPKCFADEMLAKWGKRSPDNQFRIVKYKRVEPVQIERQITKEELPLLDAVTKATLAAVRKRIGMDRPGYGRDDY